MKNNKNIAFKYIQKMYPKGKQKNCHTNILNAKKFSYIE